MVFITIMKNCHYLYCCYLFLIIFNYSITDVIFADSSTRYHRVRSPTSQSLRWNYQDVDNWGEISEICATGRQQSPIHIATHEAIMDPVLFNDPLRFINYDGSFYGTLTNTGSTIAWTINASSDRPRITGSGLAKSGFLLDQFNFHWGGEQADSNCLGSEHVIDYRSGPMEVHLIHHNAKYPSYEIAQSKPDGLAIVGFIFAPVENTILDGDYATIASLIPQISNPSTKIGMLANFPRLFPSGMLKDGVFFRYDGSLTTPPCSENVKWTVFSDRIPITENSLSFFRDKVLTDTLTLAISGKLKILENNFRPIQRIFGRNVTTNSRDAQVPPGFNPPLARQTSSSTSALELPFCKITLFLLLSSQILLLLINYLN